MKSGLVTLLSCATLFVAQDAMPQPPSSGGDTKSNKQAKACVPAALLSAVGDAGDVVDELQQRLLLLGVSNRQTSGCPAVHAQVSLAPDGIFLHLEESSGRSASITVSDVRIAATWIDSWLQDDLGAPLLAVRDSSSSGGTDRPVLIKRNPILIESSAQARWNVGLAYEASTASDDASWWGARVAVCRHVGPVCLGILSHITEDKDRFLVEDFPEFSQSEMSALAQIQVPVRVGRAILDPYLALGGSFLTTERYGLEDDCLFADEPNCEVAETRASLAPHIETGVSFSIPITSLLHLHLGASLNLRLLGQTAKVHFEEPFPCEPDAPDCDAEPQPEFITMLAEPSDFLRFSIGLELQL